MRKIWLLNGSNAQSGQRDSGLGEIAYDALLIGLRSDSRYDAMLEKAQIVGLIAINARVNLRP